MVCLARLPELCFACWPGRMDFCAVTHSLRKVYIMYLVYCPTFHSCSVFDPLTIHALTNCRPRLAIWRAVMVQRVAQCFSCVIGVYQVYTPVQSLLSNPLVPVQLFGHIWHFVVQCILNQSYCTALVGLAGKTALFVTIIVIQTGWGQYAPSCLGFAFQIPDVT